MGGEPDRGGRQADGRWDLLNRVEAVEHRSLHTCKFHRVADSRWGARLDLNQDGCVAGVDHAAVGRRDLTGGIHGGHRCRGEGELIRSESVVDQPSGQHGERTVVGTAGTRDLDRLPTKAGKRRVDAHLPRSLGDRAQGDCQR